MIDPRNLAAFAKPETPMPAPEGAEMGMEGAAEEGDQYGELRPVLEEFAMEIEECCDMLDPNALRDPGTEMDPADIEILQQSVAQLDPQLQQALQAAAGIDPASAADIGMQLEAAGLTTDGDRLAGWLYRVGQHGLAPAPEPAGEAMAPTEAAPGNPY